MTLVGLIFILTSGPLPDEIPDDNDIEFSRKQLIIGYTILVPNLLIAFLGPFIKSYRQFEAILGRSMDDSNIIIWVSLKRNRNGKFEIAYHNSFDKDRNVFRDFYALVNLVSKANAERKQFVSYQEAVDYIRNTHDLPEVRFVEKGELHSQYLKMLKTEEGA